MLFTAVAVAVKFAFKPTASTMLAGPVPLTRTFGMVSSEILAPYDPGTSLSLYSPVMPTSVHG